MCDGVTVVQVSKRLGRVSGYGLDTPSTPPFYDLVLDVSIAPCPAQIRG